MVFNLSQEEVLKVCSVCDKFIKERESCRADSDIRTLKELRRCKKWDEYFGGSCLYR